MIWISIPWKVRLGHQCVREDVQGIIILTMVLHKKAGLQVFSLFYIWNSNFLERNKIISNVTHFDSTEMSWGFTVILVTDDTPTLTQTTPWWQACSLVSVIEVLLYSIIRGSTHDKKDPSPSNHMKK